MIWIRCQFDRFMSDKTVFDSNVLSSMVHDIGKLWRNASKLSRVSIVLLQMQN